MFEEGATITPGDISFRERFAWSIACSEENSQEDDHPTKKRFRYPAIQTTPLVAEDFLNFAPLLFK